MANDGPAPTTLTGLLSAAMMRFTALTPADAEAGEEGRSGARTVGSMSAPGKTPARSPFWSQTASGRVVHNLEPVMLVLALLSVPVLLIEEASDREPWTTIAEVGNWIIWVGFAAELAFVLIVAPRKLAALRAHWLDVAIVVLTAPFLPALLGALRLFRLLPFLRLLRVARLALFGALRSRSPMRRSSRTTGLASGGRSRASPRSGTGTSFPRRSEAGSSRAC
jgi:hypothetical protein